MSVKNFKMCNAYLRIGSNYRQTRQPQLKIIVDILIVG